MAQAEETAGRDHRVAHHHAGSGVYVPLGKHAGGCLPVSSTARDHQVAPHHASPSVHEPLSRHAGGCQPGSSTANVPDSQSHGAAANISKRSPLPSNLPEGHDASSLTALIDRECRSSGQDPGLCPAQPEEKAAWQLAAERELLVKGLRGFVEALLRGRKQQHDASVLRARHGFLRLAASLQVLQEQLLWQYDT